MVEVYTVPALATTNAIISSSDANVDKGNLRFFRQFITNPAGANLVLLSNGTDGSAFNTVPDVAMTNQKVNEVNPTYSTFGSATSHGSGFFDVAATGDAPNVSGDSWGLIQYRHWNWAADYRWQLAVQFTNADQMYARSVIAGAGSAWKRLFHDGMDGAGSGIDADLLDGVQGSGYALVASGVPLNAVVWFPTLADLTAAGASWTRHTAADGRLLVGAGTTFSQTFVEATNYGANWTPSSGLTNSVVAAQTDGNFVLTPITPSPTTNLSTAAHGHPAPTITGSGTAWLIPSRAGIYGRRI